MTVGELIEFLRTKNQDLPVAFVCHSERRLLTAEEIEEEDLCEARPDGWVHFDRPDKPVVRYLVFPGN